MKIPKRLNFHEQFPGKFIPYIMIDDHPQDNKEGCLEGIG